MRLALLLAAAAVATGAEEPKRPSSCPSLDHASWSWSALYADDASHVIVISVEKGAGDSPATFLDLQPGAKPLLRAVVLSSSGMVKEGGHEIAHFANAARQLMVLSDFYLVARWECLSRTDGVDRRFSAVPIPVAPKHPLCERLRALQSQHMPVLVASPDDPRSLPSDSALLPNDMFYTSEMVTEVISWSPSVVSLLDWNYEYSGGAHGNLGFESYTWIRATDGQWRDAHLTDLFGQAVSWHQKIFDAVTKDLIRQGAGDFSNAEHVMANPISEKLLLHWNIAGDGLVISFAPYAVGPYSQGPFQVRIPWATLPPLTAGFPAEDVRGRP
jgi:hypothetical protein